MKHARLSSRGRIIIPIEVRKLCDFKEGDRLSVEGDPQAQNVTLRKISASNKWFDVYMQCPATFELAPRRREYRRPVRKV